jgi:hypothetical protein
VVSVWYVGSNVGFHWQAINARAHCPEPYTDDVEPRVKRAYRTDDRDFQALFIIAIP